MRREGESVVCGVCAPRLKGGVERGWGVNETSLPRNPPCLPPHTHQHTNDTSTYKQLIGRIGGRLGPDYHLDT